MSRSVYRNMMVLIVGITLTVIGLGLTASESAKATGPGLIQTHRFAINTAPPPRARWMKVPCVYEDSVNCQWNAQQVGNRHGHSFYVVRRPLENVHGVSIGHVICVYYVKQADHKWDACHIRDFN